jgi:hypothetical protein
MCLVRHKASPGKKLTCSAKCGQKYDKFLKLLASSLKKADSATSRFLNGEKRLEDLNEWEQFIANDHLLPLRERKKIMLKWKFNPPASYLPLFLYMEEVCSWIGRIPPPGTRTFFPKKCKESRYIISAIRQMKENSKAGQ